jgi:hypothetical protein
MDLTDIIFKTEEKYISSVEAFFHEKWGDTKLWSHDLSHHRRVWSYAKELLQYRDISDPLFVEKLLIACYLHDAGMAIDPGSKHGVTSRKLCKDFLVKNKMNLSDYQDVLDAIVNHDNKEYIESPAGNNLLLLLTVADDLDAFGYTGILRYADIYMQRGVSQDNLGRLVLENSEKRFRNFEKVFMGIPKLVDRHRNRYMILQEFYSAYNQNQ